jgi:hypothetical protein
MQKKRKQFFTGIIIVVISIVVLYINLKLFEASFGKLWPALLLLLGLILYIIYFATRKRRKRTGISFVATFVSVSSVPLFIMTFSDTPLFKYLWPGFILAVGFALVTVYFYGERKRGTLFLSQLVIAIPILIWIIYAMSSKYGLVIGVVLLMTGVTLLARSFIREQEPTIEVSDTGTGPGTGPVTSQSADTEDEGRGTV